MHVSNYQANLFLEIVEFAGGKNVSHIKFDGNFKGEQIKTPKYRKKESF